MTTIHFPSNVQTVDVSSENEKFPNLGNNQFVDENQQLITVGNT